MRAVDYSKYQGAVSLESHLSMRRDGIEAVIVGLWHGLDANRYALGCLQRGRQADLLTGGYIVVNSQPGRLAVQLGREAAGSEWERLFGVAIDVEIRGVTETILTDAFAEVERLGQRPFLYTGNWFWDIWRTELGRYPDASRYGAWVAVYNGIADLASVPPRPGYGPIIGHQYRGSTAAYGTTVDFNVFDAAWVKAWPQPPAAPPAPASPEEVLMGKIADQFAQLGREVEAQIEQAKTLPTPIPGPQGPAGPAGPAGTSAPAPTQRTYTVVSGDTLSGIAAKFGIADWRTIYNLNKATIGADPNLIQPGMVLVIP